MKSLTRAGRWSRASSVYEAAGVSCQRARTRERIDTYQEWSSVDSRTLHELACPFGQRERGGDAPAVAAATSKAKTECEFFDVEGEDHPSRSACEEERRPRRRTGVDREPRASRDETSKWTAL